MPAASAPAAGGAGGAGAAPVEEVEKPKEKTIFTVKLEKFEATAKAKIIREVKAIMPNMNLVEVRTNSDPSREEGPKPWDSSRNCTDSVKGKEVCRIGPTNLEGEPTQGRGREAPKDLDGSRSNHLPLIIATVGIIGVLQMAVSHASFTPPGLFCSIHFRAMGESKTNACLCV